jgi:hypothetical protein
MESPWRPATYSRSTMVTNHAWPPILGSNRHSHIAPHHVAFPPANALSGYPLQQLIVSSLRSLMDLTNIILEHCSREVPHLGPRIYIGFANRTAAHARSSAPSPRSPLNTASPTMSSPPSPLPRSPTPSPSRHEACAATLVTRHQADHDQRPFRHQRERRRRSRRSLAPAIPPPTQFTVTTSNPYAVLGQDKQPDKEVTAPADSAAAVKQPDTQQVQLGATVQPVARQPDKQPTGTAGPVAGPVDGLAALRMIDAKFDMLLPRLEAFFARR